MSEFDGWIKLGTGFLVGIVTLIVFGEYLLTLIAAILGVAGIGIAVALIVGAVDEIV